MAPKVKEPVRASQLSDERVVNSSDDEGAQHVKPKHKSKSKASSISQKTKEANNVVKKSKHKVSSPESTSSSGSDSESDEEDEESKDDEIVESAEKKNQQDSENQSSSDTESSTDSSSNKRKSATRAPHQEQKPRKKLKPTSASTFTIAPQSFKPPQGYDSNALTASDYTSQAASLFDDLSGKQVWHISAPDSLSIESIKELDVQAALRGDPILTEAGIEYHMHAGSSNQDVLLISHGQDCAYQGVGTKISRSFDLREMNRSTKAKKKHESNTTESKSALVFTATTEGRRKEPRKQPEGLKQRYTPSASQTYL